jgi:hypothetical protein
MHEIIHLPRLLRQLILMRARKGPSRVTEILYFLFYIGNYSYDMGSKCNAP